MCQAPLGRVVKIGKGKITVKYRKGTRELNSKFVDVKKGDYVLFSLNIAIEKVGDDEAKMMLGNVK